MSFPTGIRAEDTLFVADVHLSPARPEITAKFLRFLAERALGSKELYILGDLFDAWIGDDDDSPPHPIVIAALKAITDNGTRLFVQHGNRDFLLGRRFAQATGGQLLTDPTRIELYGIPTLLMHGDLLCTADLAYQRFRYWIRNPLLIKIFLLRSLKARRRQATHYRTRSGAATAVKPSAIMDVSQDTVEAYMHRFKVHRLIHGHTHRPGQHLFLINNTQASRLVLAEWSAASASVLCINPTGIQVEHVT